MLECTSTVRVRYVETDQMGVVHHSAYLAWMEVARTEFLRARGLPYRALEERGIRMPVLTVHADYKVPARYDDEVRLTARLAQATPVRFKFEYEMRRAHDGVLFCTGFTEHVATDLGGRPRRIPKDLVDLIGGHLEDL
jgi:acyl-CoA thioester hydrolase